MKRTNLVLDERLLEQTVKATGKKTYSEAVNEAMHEYVRKHEFTKIFRFEGSGSWSGNLNSMREKKTKRN